MKEKADSLKTDPEIIHSILGGDKELYAELVRRHQTNVVNLCQGMLQNPSMAEDAAQDIFVKVFGLLKTFQNKSLFSTWLYRIAANHCLDALRKIKRQNTQSLDGLPNAERLIKHSTDMEKQVETRDFALRILGELSESERTLLTLREGENLSYEDIGDVLHLSLDAVKSRLKRLREKIEQKARHFSSPHNV